MYVTRDAVRDLRGIIGSSRRRPRGELPAVAAVVCHSGDGIEEGPLAHDDLLGHVYGTNDIWLD